MVFLFFCISGNKVKLTFCDILAFVTGTRDKPAVELDKLTVKFNHTDEEACLPIPATCTMTITLPIKRQAMEDYKLFEEEVSNGIVNSLGTFGRV